MNEHQMIHGPLSRGQKLDFEFAQFCEENPHVYTRFRMIAVKLKARGHERWGAKGIWEVLRWELAVSTNAGATDVMLNNNYTSRMARKLMADEPEDFAGFFELRRLKGKGEPLQRAGQCVFEPE